MSKDFSDLTTKAWSIKERIDKLTPSKFKTFVLPKILLRKQKGK